MEWSEVIDNPLLKDLPFKIELNRFGKLLMSPASNKHGIAQSRIGALLTNKHPNGVTISECSIQTPEGTKVADVAWASDAFIEKWGTVTPFPRAPELCVEIVSPSNSREEMQIKTTLYLEAGAEEVWIVYIDSHLEIFTAVGQVNHTAFSEGIREQLFKITK
ncbi:Uma2 family endonuclease [uncultured Thiothrix sp.]|uniref:Uma2 family endonuclease n=1 Tax=uncultured Thiothrix sp. TaxID=223185 RepID=UPI0026178ACF|nr:Uma2 family endonuclease [uncultured Thiothrix sp.]